MKDRSLRILHLEDNDDDAKLIEAMLARNGLTCDMRVTSTRDAYMSALRADEYDLVISDSSIPGFDGPSALHAARNQFPGIPFIFVSGRLNPNNHSIARDTAGVAYVVKSELEKLAPTIRHTLNVSGQKTRPAISATRQLVNVIQELSLARDLPTVTRLVRFAARELTGADGATFILREGDSCHYLDENAIAPLWKGKRFPMSACVGGWAMLNQQALIIADIDADTRVLPEMYRDTFVKSLVMVPIRTAAPVGAIGNYWATRHTATPEEVKLLQALADSTSIALENVQLYEELDQRVKERSMHIDAESSDVKAFCFSASHDLGAPLRRIAGFSRLLLDRSGSRVDEIDRDYLQRIRQTTQQMRQLVDDLLMLSKITRSDITRQTVDLSQVANAVAADLRTTAPDREVEFIIQPDLVVRGDPQMLRIVIENLLSNAWKFTSRQPRARITVGCEEAPGAACTYYVADNGAGFDMMHADKLFRPFQRLHNESDFPGTGVGLATVHRIIQKHGGRVRGEGAPNGGAIFSFTLG